MELSFSQYDTDLRNTIRHVRLLDFYKLIDLLSELVRMTCLSGVHNTSGQE